MRPGNLAASSLGLALALLGSCSSAPKVPDEAYEKRNQATNYVKLADSLVAKGQYDSALSFYRQAVDGYSSVDWLEGASSARSSIGRLWLAWDDIPAAEAEFLKAADYARLSGSPRAIALAATGLGEVASRRGDQAGALAAFERAVAAVPKDDAALGIAYHDLASAKYALGRKAEARADLDKAVAINLKLKRWSEFASNRYLLASFLTKEGNIAGAIAAASEALVNDKKAENAPGVAGDLILLAELSGRVGKSDDSYWYWRRAFDAALGANQAVLAKRALVGLIAVLPKVGREPELENWKATLVKLDSLAK
ncbi:MAG: tetratricopeptide repeat protein [Spirochaetota bacterium]